MLADESTPLPCGPPVIQERSFVLAGALLVDWPPVALPGPTAQSQSLLSLQYGQAHSQSSITVSQLGHMYSSLLSSTIIAVKGAGLLNKALRKNRFGMLMS